MRRPDSGAPRAGARGGLDGRDDLQRLGHATGSGLAALGHLAGVRADEGDAVRFELRAVAARGGMLPHLRVHRRRHQHRLVGREQHGRGEVVGEAAGHLRHQVGGRRRDDDEVGLARQPDVADIELGLRSNRSVKTWSPASAPTDSGVTNSCAARVMNRSAPTRRARAAGGSGRATCRRRCRRR